MIEDDNTKFAEAFQDDGTSDTIISTNDVVFKTNNFNPENRQKKKKQRLNIIRLTKWSDLRKWSKVNYEGSILSNKGVPESWKNLGKKTEQWGQKVIRSLRNDIGEPTAFEKR